MVPKVKSSAQAKETNALKVLVSDKLGKGGLDILAREKTIQVDVKTGLAPEELKSIIGNYDAILIRSGTKLKKDIIEAADRLKVIGRAGVGVDNVDLGAATKKGIIVMNTPGGNTVSTCEHTFSLLLTMSRNIAQADQSMRKNEWRRKDFMGTEVYGKTLGIVGMGRIGSEITKRALAFGMKVLAFDPFISPEGVKQQEIKFVKLEDLLRRSDYITVHTPLTSETKHLLGKKSFELMKDGVRIINCARGGILDEAALCEAVKSGKVKGAALDVYEKEPPKDSPLLAFPQIVLTPHLGASTEEAQENVALQVAEQVVDALTGRGIKNAVNMPSLDAETQKALQPWITLAEKIGLLQSQLFGGSIQEVTVKYCGEVTSYQLAPLTIAVLKGLLAPICGEGVNYVNAPSYAKERGIVVNENKTTQSGDFANYIAMDVRTKDSKNTIIGTLFADKDPRIVRINEFYVDAVPKGYMLVIHNEDKPGAVGSIGTILGNNNVNIAEMTLGRKTDGKTALTVINIDSEASSKVLNELRALDRVIDVKQVLL